MQALFSLSSACSCKTQSLKIQSDQLKMQDEEKLALNHTKNSLPYHEKILPKANR